MDDMPIRTSKSKQTRSTHYITWLTGRLAPRRFRWNGKNGGRQSRWGLRPSARRLRGPRRPIEKLPSATCSVSVVAVVSTDRLNCCHCGPLDDRLRQGRQLNELVRTFFMVAGGAVTTAVKRYVNTAVGVYCLSMNIFYIHME